MRVSAFWIVVEWWVLLLAMPARAAEPPVDYSRQVKPILQRRCYACHGVLQQKSRLRLDTAAFARQGGDLGPALVPGHAAESLLIDAVTGEPGIGKMPPPDQGSPLTPAEVGILRRWINEGAAAPANEQPEPDPRTHWAFQPVIRPPVPRVSSAEWNTHPIDAFLARSYEQQHLQPARLASKTTLLRRLTLDLTGLPPAPEELQAFLSDSRPDAYTRVVDRLLADTAYAERWARHWMDVWRYADWYGRRSVPDVWNSAPQIWRWRDWIVRSLQADKGYDQMVREMLAADEIVPGDDNNVVATGYLVRNWYALNSNAWMREIVEHTGKAFLGLTYNCAHCHDHKYDPITQEDYFRLRAFFEPLDMRQDRVPGQDDPGPFAQYEYLVLRKIERRGLIRVFDGQPQEPTWMYAQGDERNRIPQAPAIRAGVPGFLAAAVCRVAPVNLPQEDWYPALKPWWRKLLAEEAREAVRKAEAVLKQSREAVAKPVVAVQAAGDPGQQKGKPAVNSTAPADTVPRIRALRVAELNLEWMQAKERSVAARLAADAARYLHAPGNLMTLQQSAAQAEAEAYLCEARLQHLNCEFDYLAARAQALRAESKGQAAADRLQFTSEQNLTAAETAVVAAQQALRQPGTAYTPLSPVYPSQSTGRRRALAEWLTDRRNPLTARVAVNHIWLRHFGKALVESVYDFGRNGKPSSHPDLHNWLAAEFVEHGWSMKHLHRLIVTSRAYRLETAGSAAGEANRHLDPENRYLTAFPRRRLEAEGIRDSLLACAGILDRTTGGQELETDAEFTSNRRSLYYACHPEGNGHLKFLETFDAPSPGECYRRAESLIPQQALSLTNGALILKLSRALGRQLWNQTAQPRATLEQRQDAFISAAFLRILSRPPVESERRACRQFLTGQVALYAAQLPPSDRPGVATEATGKTSAAAERKVAVPGTTTARPGGSRTAVPQDPTEDRGDNSSRAAESLVRVLFNHTDFLTLY